MPAYAYLSTSLRCPECDEVVADLLCFHWGYLPGAKVRADLLYHLGDAVRWRACTNGDIPPWARFGPLDYNAGDPTTEDLVVMDANGWLDDYVHDCGNFIGGAAIEIRGGVLRRAWLCAPGDFERADDQYPAGTDHYELGPDTETLPRPDWTHHSITQVDATACGEAVRLVIPHAPTREPDL